MLMQRGLDTEPRKHQHLGDDRQHITDHDIRCGLYQRPYYTTLLILVGISNQGETAAIGSDLSSFRI
jgi:hypothetical protein